MINDGRRDCVHGSRWCAQCCWSGGRSTKEFLAGVASLPPGTVPGDQGGEPRRPQVGDVVDVCGAPETGEVILAKVIVVAESPDGRPWFRAKDDKTTYGRFIADERKWWRWPATQGAAVAGPARVCPCCTDETIPADADCTCPSWCHEQQETRPGHRTTPPPPASEPLTWPRDPKAPASPPPPGAVKTKQTAKCSRCGHEGDVWFEATPLYVETLNEMVAEAVEVATAAKAALEVQLRDERAAHARTTELWRRDEEKGIAAERALRDERDALAAQLKAAREAAAVALAEWDHQAGRFYEAMGDENPRLEAVVAKLEGLRAALAASEAAKEET